MSSMLSLLCYQKYTCLYPFNFILLGIGRAEYVLGMIYLLVIWVKPLLIKLLTKKIQIINHQVWYLFNPFTKKCRVYILFIIKISKHVMNIISTYFSFLSTFQLITTIGNNFFFLSTYFFFFCQYLYFLFTTFFLI